MIKDLRDRYVYVDAHKDNQITELQLQLKAQDEAKRESELHLKRRIAQLELEVHRRDLDIERTQKRLDDETPNESNTSQMVPIETAVESYEFISIDDAM